MSFLSPPLTSTQPALGSLVSKEYLFPSKDNSDYAKWRAQFCPSTILVNITIHYHCRDLHNWKFPKIGQLPFSIQISPNSIPSQLALLSPFDETGPLARNRH